MGGRMDGWQKVYGWCNDEPRIMPPLPCALSSQKLLFNVTAGVTGANLPRTWEN